MGERVHVLECMVTKQLSGNRHSTIKILYLVLEYSSPRLILLRSLALVSYCTILFMRM